MSPVETLQQKPSPSVTPVITPRRLIVDYEVLCERYLPLKSDDMWRYSRKMSSADPCQGWKLHLAATIHSANAVLQTVAPILTRRNIFFKAPKSLIELGKLNAGVIYGYTQVGKFMTVYPSNEEKFLDLAHELHLLTDKIPAPFIPFDLRYCPTSNVYLRYGAFQNFEMPNTIGKVVPAIYDPAGRLVPDRRDQVGGKPEWVSNPFPIKEKAIAPKSKNPLQIRYKIFHALSQRGKGGVYAALDLQSQPPRLCLIKEGRKNGEVNWLGADGYNYVKREAETLAELYPQGLGVPERYATFVFDENFYLVTEFIEGVSLHKLLAHRKRRLSVWKALTYSSQVAVLLEKLHAHGWVWHDCKPANLMVTKNGDLRPVDFEGACRKTEKIPLVWGTDDFLPVDWTRDFRRTSTASLDLFSLGAVIYYLFSGRLYSIKQPVPLGTLRRNLPPNLENLVAALLNPNPQKRPSAKKVVRILRGDLTSKA